MTPGKLVGIRELLVNQEETPVERVENPEKGEEPKKAESHNYSLMGGLR